MALYNVFRSENRREGRTDFAGTAEAETKDDAIAIAQSEIECKETCHLWVEEVTEDEGD